MVRRTILLIPSLRDSVDFAAGDGVGVGEAAVAAAVKAKRVRKIVRAFIGWTCSASALPYR